jgi:hypothetical protein
MSTPDPAKKADALALFKGFLAEHPELIAELTSAAAELAAGPPTPLTLFGIVHDMIDAFRGPVDMERRAQMHAAVDEHEAEHQALVAAMHEHQAAAAPSPAAEAPSSPAPGPAELPVDSDPVTG